MAGSLYGLSKISEITPHLLLTSVYGATRENIIRNNCTLLVNCAQELPKQDIVGVESIKLFLDDMPYAIINVYFDRIADKIHEHANRGGRTIIHCVCGISRAASITIAYLMKYKNMSLRSGYEYVLGRRSCIRPNKGFWRQLVDYEKRLMAHPSQTGRRELSNQQNNSNINITRQTEISIPIQIVSGHRNHGQQSNQPRLSRSGSFRVNDYVVPSHGYNKQGQQTNQQRFNSSNTYSRDRMESNYYHSPPMRRSHSTTKLFDDFNATHTIPLPHRSEYVTYESSISKKYSYPNGNYRSSLFIDDFNEPRLSTHKPSSYSTAYRSIIDRY